MKLRAWTAKYALGILLAACAEDLRDGVDAGEPALPALPVTNSEEADSVTRTVIDATDDKAWVYFDFEGKSEVTPATPEDSAEWDLGFQRFRIKLNGGDSGSGEMELARLEDVDFEAVEQPPSNGYVTDQPDGADENSDADLAFSSGEQAWYAYDPSNHTLTARPYVYVVRSVEGRFYKLQLLEYYDRAGTGGFPSFRWIELETE